jgi:hypothetical protein
MSEAITLGALPGIGGEVDMVHLRQLADAAAEQLRVGPQEWPGAPSRQRLELFLATGPDTVLWLLDRIKELEGAVGSA